MPCEHAVIYAMAPNSVGLDPPFYSRGQITGRVSNLACFCFDPSPTALN